MRPAVLTLILLAAYLAAPHRLDCASTAGVAGVWAAWPSGGERLTAGAWYDGRACVVGVYLPRSRRGACDYAVAAGCWWAQLQLPRGDDSLDIWAIP